MPLLQSANEEKEEFRRSPLAEFRGIAMPVPARRYVHHAHVVRSPCGQHSTIIRGLPLHPLSAFVTRARRPPSFRTPWRSSRRLARIAGNAPYRASGTPQRTHDTPRRTTGRFPVQIVSRHSSSSTPSGKAPNNRGPARCTGPSSSHPVHANTRLRNTSIHWRSGYRLQYNPYTVYAA